ncbi:chemotaxis protein CheB [Ktedonobacter sp. SOSP1-85]|uniref:chemotaxis protein CheB n=1 Tax=Ktedonobacter sp. SOSP1-85 TaxID=2778367 RepID=UPI0019154AF0|nr:chemotaxis protein CheB [Ktedonobacter sp. SOSP1-85]
MDTTFDTNSTFNESPSEQPAFPVVGIGASAGGLEAFTQLLRVLPVDTGMAYVVIQHLDPTRASLLPSLLAHIAPMPVHEAQDDMILELDHVYVIPPQADMTLKQDTLKLSPRRQDLGQPFLIDTFFRSLAHERGQQAIGVLLSGTASDGTVGLQEIKAEGGITFAQDEHSAAFPQMPHNAITAGCVDHVLPPEGIASVLTRLSSHSYLSQAQITESVETLQEEEQALTNILLVLRQQTGVDFLTYKRGTLKRRILHRMAVLQVERFAEYATYLRERPAEIDALYQDALLPVTSFFRDEAAFDALTLYAFPDIVQHLTPGDAIRIWVPGCSTGEEAYSLVICLLEFLEERSLTPPVQLLATDINPRVLERARKGIYPANALSAVSLARLERFFTPIDQEKRSYCISQAIRERCIFALHNVTKDPPFSRLDLVSCRNVLIYLEPALQQKVIQIFHYALNPHRFLLLGVSENVDPQSRLFTPVERRQKLYARNASKPRPPLSVVTSEGVLPASNPQEGGTPMPEETTPNGDIQQEADRLLLANYIPASVIINTEMEILQVRGHTGPYLELAPGKTSLNLLKMARDGLRLGLRMAIHAARKDNRPVTKDGLQVVTFGTAREIRVTVIPLKGPPAEHYFLVLFEDMAPPVPATPLSGEQTDRTSKRGLVARRIAALELELATTRAEIQEMLEERDSANEKLQAANEEIRCSNEELQSINEELEASQEELVTSNQEVTTSNQELEAGNEQLKVVQERADAIVETVREPLVVLSDDLHVERANDAFYQVFKVEPWETEGCCLYDLGNAQWNIPRLRMLLEQVHTTNQPFHDFEVEHTFPLIGHKVMLLNARRVLHEHKSAKGPLILLAIEDITERKELERQKDALLGMANHELKTPIASAKLALQMLQRRLSKAGDEQSTTQLGKVDAHLNGLASLIDGFLDATAIETGRLLLHPALFAIDDLVREICEEIERTTPSQHILFAQETHSEVYGDRARTGEVLCNLLTNAIKYSPSAASIEVRVVGDADMVTVSVQDHGEGIPQDLQTRIFERYYRVSDTKQKRQPGAGLGLYLAAEITKQQGGQIWVESVPGEGATFFFTIPGRSASGIC